MVSEDAYVDIQDLTREIDGDFLARLDTATLASEVARRVASGQAQLLGKARIGAPIARPHQVLCIGLNFSDHAAETGMAIPEDPIVFNKAPNTVVGPNDDVVIPRGSLKTDWEVELGVVMGAQTRYLNSPDEAMAHIAGFVLVNDVSERAFQLERGGQWVKGKSCETFNPCGPVLVTTDEIADVQGLGMWLDVNGVRRQTGTTQTMVFDVSYLIWYLSQFLVLEAGDLINTGTPPGVGMGMTPQTFLQVGDVMELGIDQLGTQRQRLVSAK
jgi:2-keto-4-pentenoate hydratase/2-oxohepta-3-ene-1,7-dioic acid hydratase in catechol pathway